MILINRRLLLQLAYWTDDFRQGAGIGWMRKDESRRSRRFIIAILEGGLGMSSRVRLRADNDDETVKYSEIERGLSFHNNV